MHRHFDQVHWLLFTFFFFWKSWYNYRIMLYSCCFRTLLGRELWKWDKYLWHYNACLLADKLQSYFKNKSTKYLRTELLGTPVQMKGHGCDRCGQESHLACLAYKMELMGWEAEGLRLADVSRGHACYWHSCHLRCSFHLSAGIERRIPTAL